VTIIEKLAILADAAKYDASCASSGVKRSSRGGLGNSSGVGICHSYTPDGRCVSLLKILLTNYCIYDCQFCVNRVSSATPRARFAVEEVVQLTLDFYRRNYIEGLFLSSGIIQSPDYTMEQLVAVARTLRTEHAYRGYIHLKAIPLASEELIAEAGRWADRLSANVELPTPDDLARLAPEKKLADIETTMGQIGDRVAESRSERRVTKHAPKFAPAGQSTQMVIGATPATDREVLTASSSLYRRHRLRRVYYSAFSPIPHADSRLPSQSPPLVREHRLYQADWLLRFYGFDASEITSAAQPNLDLTIDPKHAWALGHREQFPVDVNRADRALLLRVPGFGARNVGRILRLRRHQRLRTTDLKKLRVSWRRAAPFVVTADYNPAVFQLDSAALASQAVQRERQLSLFDMTDSARSGAENFEMKQRGLLAEEVHVVGTFEAWRWVARSLLDADVMPQEAAFVDAFERQQLLEFAAPADESPPRSTKSNQHFAVPRNFLTMARTIAFHRSSDRWSLLYRMLWRLTHGESHLLELSTDEDVYGAERMEKQVRRDAHKMKAFVRFRRLEEVRNEWFVAWHRPDHRIARLVAPFFADRFANMKWTILTPDESISWDGEELTHHAGTGREAAPSADELEKLWLTYYGAIFNPARIKLKAMRKEMPVRHWPTLPETRIIDELLAAAPARVAQMHTYQEGWSRSAVDYLPVDRSLASLRAAAACCEGCPLFEPATQTVFGEGNPAAKLVLVGEQPGDEEDRAGRPFVGPAGRLLDELLGEAGIARSEVYLTNSVKHFSHEERGKRRLHKKPRRLEVASCRAWLESELAAIAPRVIVALGATAAASLISPAFRLTDGRGKVVATELCKQTIATFHPSAILRTPDMVQSEAKRSRLVKDLRQAWQLAIGS
jgi:probable DNA metabolism protein